jgi:hypothetical protein
MSVRLRAAVWNLTNPPIFPGNPTSSPASANFGKLLPDTGQTNAPRLIMPGLRISFLSRRRAEKETES